MSNKKKCRICGKTITDKNNKTGLCPEHQGKAGTVLGGLALIALTFGGGILRKVLKKR